MALSAKDRVRKSRDLARFRERADALEGSLIGPLYLLHIPGKPDRLLRWTGSQWDWLT